MSIYSGRICETCLIWRFPLNQIRLQEGYGREEAALGADCADGGAMLADV